MRDEDLCYWPTTDDSVHRWMHENPDGLVLNVERSPRAGYLVLHRSGCPHIESFASGTPGAFTQRDYRKVCALTRRALKAWVRDHGSPEGRFSQECSICKARPE
jgi:hypothetical protein